MSTFPDEPVLLQPDTRRDWKSWAAVAVALFITGVVIYIPVDKARKEKAAHETLRGPHRGVLVHLTLDGSAHTLELMWNRHRFAPVLVPAPAVGTTLRIAGRFGEETLAWNGELGAFGPTTAKVDPLAHYKLSLRLEREGRMLWSDAVWAYGVHETRGHTH
jgi:hypothetical protein